MSRQSGGSGVVTNIKQLYQQVADSGEGVNGEAEKILELLNDHEMGDWAEGQLHTIHRRRRQYGANETIRRIHHKLIEEVELIDPETVIETGIALMEHLDGNTS